MVPNWFFVFQFLGFPILTALLVTVAGILLLTRLGQNRVVRVVVAIGLFMLAILFVAFAGVALWAASR